MGKMKIKYTSKSLSSILSILSFLLISPPIAFAQNPLISISPEEGFIFELYPNNPQTTFMFTIFNNGQTSVSLNLKVESADSTYIIYIDEPDTATYNGNIWRMSPNGSEKTQLTYDLLDREAVWSPDGMKILFWSYRSGNADIWVMNSDGSNLINLTNHPSFDYYPHYSPDGQYIIFNSTRDDPNGEVYKMTSSGEDVERLTFNNFPGFRPRYSPDGQYFAAQTRTLGGEYNIYVFTSDGQNYINIGQPNIIDDFQPSWSPDGKRVVWISGDEIIGGLNIVSANKDSSDFKVEFATSENDYYPRYSPDGQFLAFSKSTFNSTGGDEIFIWHKALDTLIQITDNTPISREWGPEWSPFLGSPIWPLVSQNTIQVLEGDSIGVDININASGLPFGQHTASIMIFNAETDILLAAVPLNLFYYQELDVQAGSELSETYSLSQNYPNPFNSTTKIEYLIPAFSFVTLKVFDVLGKEVATLVSEEKPASSYELEFNASDLPSGVYFYKITAGDYVETKKMIFMK